MPGKTFMGKTLIGLTTAIRGKGTTDTVTTDANVSAMPPVQSEADLKKKLNELKIMDLAAHNDHHETNV